MTEKQDKYSKYKYTEGIEKAAYVIDEAAICENIKKLQKFGERTGITVLLALKGFANWKLFPLLQKYSVEASCSSVNEYKLAEEHLGTPIHSYFVSYNDSDFSLMASHCKTLTFNSLSQYNRFFLAFDKYSSCQYGIRINPQSDLVGIKMYNPCGLNSRLGVSKSVYDDFLKGQKGSVLPSGVTGLHFHALCEDLGEGICSLIDIIERDFDPQLQCIEWLNLGGGHLITSSDYDYDRVITRMRSFSKEYSNVRLYIEPSSAFAWQSGVLVTKVVDVVAGRDCDTIIIDASFSCHIPDSLEMPYRPNAILLSKNNANGNSNGGNKWVGNIGGNTCLAGDMVVGYSFDACPRIGDVIIFEDMVHYTMVKTTFFNGVAHPSILLNKSDGTIEILQSFGYDDYKGKL